LEQKAPIEIANILLMFNIYSYFYVILFFIHTWLRYQPGIYFQLFPYSARFFVIL